MAIEGAKELSTVLSAIRKGRTKPVYVVHGSEGYLVRTAADALANALAEGSGAEVVRIDAAGRSPETLLEEVASPTLFAPGTVALLRNFSHLLTGESADRLLAGIDAGLGESNFLVFVAAGDGPADKIDKRFKGTKGLLARGAAIELNTQKPEHLAVWLSEKAAEEGKVLEPDAATLLLERAGRDMETLRRELDKALLFCLDQKRIAADDLEKLIGRSREDAVWDVGEAVASRDPVRAMALLDDLLDAGTYPLAILTLLIRQTRHLLQARLLWEGAGRPSFGDYRSFQSRVASAGESGAFGRGADDVTTIHPFARFKRFEAARRRSVGELRAVLSRLCRADREAKTGVAAGPREVLEELVLDLCARGSRAA
jgi:DNA polymerase-3 subunit delta